MEHLQVSLRASLGIVLLWASLALAQEVQKPPDAAKQPSSEKGTEAGKKDSKEGKPEHHRGPGTMVVPHHEMPPNLAELLHLQPFPMEEPWLPPTSGPFTTFTAPIIAKDHLTLQPFFFYNWVRGTFDERSHFRSLQEGEMRQSAVWSLFMQYGLLDNIELDAQLFLIHNRARVPGERVTLEDAQGLLDEYQADLENGELFEGQWPLKPGPKSGSSTGLGDTLLMLRYNLLHQTPSWHPEVSLLTQIKLPTGKYQHADPAGPGTDIMGAGSTDLTLGLDFTKSIKPFILHADLWYSWPMATRVDGVRTKYGDYVNWNVGLEVPFCRNKLAYMLEFTGVHQGYTHADGVELPSSNVNNVAFSTGLEIIFSEQVQLLIGYQRTLSGKNVDALDSVGATLVWCF